ncbi:hypothetical protein BDZ89DRAFT_1134689 [Hymenopellis radicata]|nr:hypothetical protein BDZ89DRAFT_1134689 [Hymenopellis radicata]
MYLTRNVLKLFAAAWKDDASHQSSLAAARETLKLESSLPDLIFLSKTHDQLSPRNTDPDVKELLRWVAQQDRDSELDFGSPGNHTTNANSFASSSTAHATAVASTSTAYASTSTAHHAQTPPRKRRAQTSVEQKKKPTLPQVTYQQQTYSKRVRSGEKTTALGPRPKRNHRRKVVYKKKILEEADTFAVAEGLDASTDLPITTTGWMGLRASIPPHWARTLRTAHRSDNEVWEYLERLKFLPYLGRATQVLDSTSRRLIFRSKITSGMESLAAEFGKEAAAFVKACKPPSDADIAGNQRGNHWFCIAGADRNNKSIPALSKWHGENAPVIKEYFAPKRVFTRANNIANDLLRLLFPAIAARYLACADYMRTHHKIEPMFGLFWNWCLNAPLAGVKRVFCDPHVDFKNLALGVCIVFVYGVFNHREKAWLVIWEAGVCLELPPGVFLIYPSSLFYHFNVDIVTTPDGTCPTPENSKPLAGPTLTRPENVSEEDWEAGNGRGSVVWFNQASMFQTSETGFKTLTVARKAGHSGNANIEELLGEEGALPRV